MKLYQAQQTEQDQLGGSRTVLRRKVYGSAGGTAPAINLLIPRAHVSRVEA